MFKRSIYVSFAVTFLFSFVFCHTAIASFFVFNKNLKLGDTGEDVFELQKVLNSDISTVVSLDGPGSKGNETYYFGEKTRLAVVAFQNKYASEILTPNGLFYGTGFVGVSTRAKLNSIDMASMSDTSGASAGPGASVTASSLSLPTFTSIPAQTTTQAPFDPSTFTPFNFFSDTDDKVQVAFLSIDYGKHGSLLEITGNNFSLTDNKIHFGAHVVSGVSAESKNKIKFIIPDSIPVGIYKVEVQNQSGKSENNAYFVVASDGATLPKINNVSPTSLSLGDEVVVTGENFTTTGNMVRTNLGVFENISSSDGKTLKFDVEAPDDLDIAKLFEIDENFEMPVFMYVVNTNGVSDKLNPSIITLKNI